MQATGEHFTGKVTRFTDALDPSTRTMQVEIDVPNPKYALQPGMYADVTLEANSSPDALTIPITAIQRSAGNTTVVAGLIANRPGENLRCAVGSRKPEQGRDLGRP